MFIERTQVKYIAPHQPIVGAKCEVIITDIVLPLEVRSGDGCRFIPAVFRNKPTVAARNMHGMVLPFNCKFRSTRYTHARPLLSLTLTLVFYFFNNSVISKVYTCPPVFLSSAQYKPVRWGISRRQLRRYWRERFRFINARKVVCKTRFLGCTLADSLMSISSIVESGMPCLLHN